MLTLATPTDLAALAGQEIGVGDWITVDQRTIDLFAEATGDHQWIHIDVERAARDAPGGKTIAHGYLTLALIPRLIPSVYAVVRKSRVINYGLNKVRFTAPIPSGSRVRLRSMLKTVEEIDGGYRFTFGSTIELEGSERPAAVVENVIAMFN